MMIDNHYVQNTEGVGSVCFRKGDSDYLVLFA